jgi:hypothetical protein
VRIDPARAVPSSQGPASSSQPLARLIGVHTDMSGSFALYSVRSHGLLRYEMGVPPPGASIVFSGAELVPDMPATRALAIDHEGFLLYAEASGADTESLSTRLREAGVRAAMALPEAARLAFGVDDKWVAVDGSHELLAERGPSELGFWSDPRPAAGIIFPDNKALPYYQWAGVQNQRVRYFPSGTPRFRAPADAFRASPPSAHAEDVSPSVASRP